MSASEIFSYCVSLASIVVAAWQTIKNANLKKYIKSDAMELYSDAGILLGCTQACMKELLEDNGKAAMQEVGKAEGIAQALFQRSIKNIFHHFAFTRKNIDEWVETKKIGEHHKEAFLKYAEK